MSSPYPSSPAQYSSPLPTATSFQRTMAVVAWAMVVLGSMWVIAGHALLGDGGGWMVLSNLIFVAPVYGVIVLTHAILVTVYGRKISRFAAAPKASKAALAFTCATLLYPLSVTDFGDTGDVSPARLTAWFGVPESVTAVILSIFLLAMLVTGILMIVFDIIELRALPTAAPRAPHLTQQRFPQ